MPLPERRQSLKRFAQRSTSLLMTRQKVRILIPLLIILCFLINTFIQYINGEFLLNWRHYIGMAGFIGLVFLYVRSFKWVVLSTGIYFLIAICNGLNITASTITFWLGPEDNHTPPFQPHSLGLFILYFVLNLDNLIEIWLDYKEEKLAKTS
jgi:hypothetical protein